MSKSLMVISGGMDSVVCLYDHKDEIGGAVSFNYGSNHNGIELQWAKYHCKKLGIDHVIINLAEAMSGFESGLLSGAEAIPEGHYEDATMKRTVVPFRNAIMMSLAVGLAESRELSKVMLASHAGDHAVYPDCRVEFNNAFAEAARLGTHAGIEVVMPYSDITKRDIAMKGYGLGVVWPATWSCYKGADVDADILNNSNGVGAWSAKLKDVTDRPTHCGRCSTCVERIWALKGLDDDTIYDDPDFARELLIEKGEW